MMFELENWVYDNNIACNFWIDNEGNANTEQTRFDEIHQSDDVEKWNLITSMIWWMLEKKRFAREHCTGADTARLNHMTTQAHQA